MKKVFWLMFLLMGCMSAPQRAFQVDPDVDTYTVQVGKLEVVPMSTHFDMLPHVENKMPTTPEEAIQEWAHKHLHPNLSDTRKLVIVVETAEMLKSDIPSGHFFKSDEESYTLNYKLLVQVRQDSDVIQSFPVEGKGFVTVAKRASLSAKEKGWAWLIQKMLTHLKTKMKTDLKDVFME